MCICYSNHRINLEAIRGCTEERKNLKQKQGSWPTLNKILDPLQTNCTHRTTGPGSGFEVIYFSKFACGPSVTATETCAVLFFSLSLFLSTPFQLPQNPIDVNHYTVPYTEHCTVDRTSNNLGCSFLLLRMQLMSTKKKNTTTRTTEPKDQELESEFIYNRL